MRKADACSDRDFDELVRRSQQHDQLIDALDKIELSAKTIASLPTCGERLVLLGIATLARVAIDTGTRTP